MSRFIRQVSKIIVLGRSRCGSRAKDGVSRTMRDS